MLLARRHRALSISILASLLLCAPALAEHAHAEPVLDDRPRRARRAKYRVVGLRRLDLRRLPRLALAASPSAPRRRSTASTCRSCGTPTSRSSAARKSGAVASRHLQQQDRRRALATCRRANTRVVTFEMCGNDGLQARSSFAGQSGTCNYAPLNTARDNCTTYTQLAMQYINANAYAGHEAQGGVEPLLPGLRRRQRARATAPTRAPASARTSRTSSCRYIAQMNWRACNFAAQYGFACADSFAQYMGADYDSNGDGQIDSEALRYVQGESEAAYVDQHHDHATLDAPRRQHPLRQRRARASTTSSRTTRTRPTPARRSASASSAARARARARRTTAAARSWAARTRSGTSSATSAWAGRSRSSTRRRRRARSRRGSAAPSSDAATAARSTASAARSVSAARAHAVARARRCERARADASAQRLAASHARSTLAQSTR